ncbi:arylsulfatase I-like [Littorina saxatilis]|uniref:arylsulfatase I-like n=1 Tax=Littorina saxatilis TaxID=31220 RepID=UPI0038B5EBFA
MALYDDGWVTIRGFFNLWPFFFILLSAGQTVDAAGKPHILQILTTHVAWSDVGWRSDDFRTPTLDRLRKEGVELFRLYAQPKSLSAQVALATGRYPYTLGIRASPGASYHSQMNFSLPLEYKLVQEYLQDQGYATKLVGKWLLGFCDWAHTPLSRGFESHYGTLASAGDHYNHTVNRAGGYDFRSDKEVEWGAQGKYLTTLLNQRAVDIVRNHSDSNDPRPLFISLSHGALHAPLQAPDKYVNMCSHISDSERRLRCAMMAAIDEGVQEILDVMSDVGYDDNLLVVFTPVNAGGGNYGSETYPLRGKKATLYEGGIRVPAFFHSKTLLPNSSFVYRGLMHQTDMLPTLLKAAKVATADLPTDIDGVNNWNRIVNKKPSARKIIVHDVDVEYGWGAVRDGKWKLIYFKHNASELCVGWLDFPREEKKPKKVTCKEWELYDMNQDPGEENDLSELKLSRLNKMKRLYADAEARAVPHLIVVNTTRTYPDNFGGVWTPYGC